MIEYPRTIEELINEIKSVEGWPEYTNKPTDRGGPTKGGITLATLGDWRGHACTVEDLIELKESEADEIYLKKYIQQPRFDRIADALLRYQVVDSGVLGGVGAATKLLQGAVGVAVDGRWGPNTERAVNEADPHFVGLMFAANRISRLGRIVTNDPINSANAAGWMIRATSFLRLESARFKVDYAAGD